MTTLNEFANDIFDEHYPNLPQWVDEEKFRNYWTEQFKSHVEETLEIVYDEVMTNKSKRTERIFEYSNCYFNLPENLITSLTSRWFYDVQYFYNEKLRYFIPACVIREYIDHMEQLSNITSDLLDSVIHVPDLVKLIKKFI